MVCNSDELFGNLTNAVNYFFSIRGSRSVETMKELWIDEPRDLYSAEKQIIRALPNLAKALRKNR